MACSGCRKEIKEKYRKRMAAKKAGTAVKKQSAAQRHLAAMRRNKK